MTDCYRPYHRWVWITLHFIDNYYLYLLHGYYMIYLLDFDQNQMEPLNDEYILNKIITILNDNIYAAIFNVIIHLISLQFIITFWLYQHNHHLMHHQHKYPDDCHLILFKSPSVSYYCYLNIYSTNSYSKSPQNSIYTRFHNRTSN